MGMFGRFKEAVGIGDPVMSQSGQGDRRHSPKVSDVLVVTSEMEGAWKKDASRNAMDSADLTRADAIRRFGQDLVLPKLPGERADRIGVLSEAFMNRSYDRFDRHVEEVQKLYGLPDAQLARMFDIQGPVPRDLRGRADAISMGIMDRDSNERALEDDVAEQRMQARIMGPDRSDLAAQLAGEPDYLAALSEGDPKGIEDAERRFRDGLPRHHIDDPSMREIAETIVDVAANWGRGVGDIENDPHGISSDRAVEIRALEASGKLTPTQRDDVLVDAYVDHVLASHPKAEAAWRRETAEIVQESAAFLHDRYGVVPPTGGDVTRDVARLEVSRLVGRVRYEDMVQAKDLEIVEPTNSRREQPNPVKDAAFAMALMSGLGR